LFRSENHNCTIGGRVVANKRGVRKNSAPASLRVGRNPEAEVDRRSEATAIGFIPHPALLRE
jgi:hypothetical protein